MKLLFATNNAGKLKEVKGILGPLGFEVVGLREAGLCVEVVEDGATFTENALKKARELNKLSHLPVLADDTGLSVDSLGGFPGVRSARYAGEKATDADNNEKLLEELKGVPAEKRTAAFICHMVFIGEGGTELHAEGVLKGKILEEKRGSGGFGYDPLFVPEGETKTLADMELSEKNLISHRRKALDQLAKSLRTRSKFKANR
ncbi:RdgB/HAM1 family non-canonical purine NTP pyrophosphatase [bacterium]|nr:MAG: RdgB/HAM1 family non-canonical purine NTP pyrophosphatase [bacterium]